MQYTSLNRIVRSVLNQKGYTIHWYFQYLKYAADCLRELHFDSLKVVQTKKIPVNNYNAIPLPCDYVDFIKVGLVANQMVYPLVQHKGINRLNNLDSNGDPIRYGQSDEVIWTRSSTYLYTWENQFGESIGRDFGYKATNDGDGFKVLRERGEIQLSEGVSADYVILEYISDGTGLPDAATKLDPYCQKTIEAYIEWQGSRNRNNIQSPEAIAYQAEHRKLRARKNNLTVDDIKRIISRNKQASPK